MLKRKLARQGNNTPQTDTGDSTSQNMLSGYFATPFWKKLYDLEVALNEDLRGLPNPPHITHIYNPVEYASEVHCDYLRRYLNGPKRLMFVGMNPGPNGMAQTGVPFGNVATVRDLMGLSGEVQQPVEMHPKRPVHGLQCSREEPSGVRIWGLLHKLANNSLDTFAQCCFVHNFCPLVYYDVAGKSITPPELKGEVKNNTRDLCLRTLDEQLTLLQPEIVIAVGSYVFDVMKKSRHRDTIRVIKMPHPSPRSVNNHNWEEKAGQFLVENDLCKYLRNEV